MRYIGTHSSFASKRLFSSLYTKRQIEFVYIYIYMYDGAYGIVEFCVYILHTNWPRQKNRYDGHSYIYLFCNDKLAERVYSYTVELVSDIRPFFPISIPSTSQRDYLIFTKKWLRSRTCWNELKRLKQKLTDLEWKMMRSVWTSYKECPIP